MSGHLRAAEAVCAETVFIHLSKMNAISISLPWLYLTPVQALPAPEVAVFLSSLGRTEMQICSLALNMVARRK
jgi:hypothetical protein